MLFMIKISNNAKMRETKAKEGIKQKNIDVSAVYIVLSIGRK